MIFPGRCVEERAVGAAVDKGCRESSRILCNEYRGQVCLLLLNGRNCLCKCLRRPARILDGNTAEAEIGTDAGECLVPHPPGDCCDLSRLPAYR